MKDTLTILSYKIQSKTSVSHLTKIQKIVCKWFHITPEERYAYTLGANIDANNPIRPGDNILMQDETQWFITKEKKGYIELKNFVSLTSLNIRIGDSMIIYCNSWSEGSSSPAIE